MMQSPISTLHLKSGLSLAIVESSHAQGPTTFSSGSTTRCTAPRASSHSKANQSSKSSPPKTRMLRASITAPTFPHGTLGTSARTKTSASLSLRAWTPTTSQELSALCTCRALTSLLAMFSIHIWTIIGMASTRHSIDSHGSPLCSKEVRTCTTTSRRLAPCPTT